VVKSKSSVTGAASEVSAPTAFLNINKPKGITSHDVVHRVRKLTGIKQVGHAGTLDPMATGVMVVALGKACRLLRFLDDDKSYKATITLGVITDTDDIEGKVMSENPLAQTNPPSREELLSALAAFTGTIEQIPPYYSAIHVDGKRLYEMARAGKAPPEIKARTVTIDKLDLLSYAAPIVTLRVHCSKGTYIRSIARDLGEKLGMGGTLSGLVRESAGRFMLGQSCDLEDLGGGKESLHHSLVKIEDAIKMPLLTVSESCAKRLVMGQKIALSELDDAVLPEKDMPAKSLTEIFAQTDYILIVDSSTGQPFCIGRLSRSGSDQENQQSQEKYLAPEVVFAS